MSEETNTLPCSEKLAFESKQAAEGAAVAITYQRGITLHAYKCQHCGLWHLSSSS